MMSKKRLAAMFLSALMMLNALPFGQIALMETPPEEQQTIQVTQAPATEAPKPKRTRKKKEE